MKTSPIDLERRLPPQEDAGLAGPGAGLVIGRFAGFDPRRQPLVLIGKAGDGATRADGRSAAAPETRPVPAIPLSTAAGDLATARIGDPVLLARTGGADPAVVLIGFLATGEGSAAAEPAPIVRFGRGRREARLDGQTVTLEAQNEITLKCGRSSLTLRRNGEVVLRGVRVLSRASQTQRIRGASVQIN